MRRSGCGLVEGQAQLKSITGHMMAASLKPDILNGIEREVSMNEALLASLQNEA